MTWGEIESTPFRLDGSDTPYAERNHGPSFKVRRKSPRMIHWIRVLNWLKGFSDANPVSVFYSDSRAGQEGALGFKDGEWGRCQNPCQEAGGLEESVREPRKVKLSALSSNEKCSLLCRCHALLYTNLIRHGSAEHKSMTADGWLCDKSHRHFDRTLKYCCHWDFVSVQT